MKQISVFLLLVLITACSPSRELDYSTTNSLEQPPPNFQAVEVNVAKTSKETDESSVSDRHFNKGVSNDVYRDENQSHIFWIKRSIEESWVMLGEAIRLNEFQITNRNRKQGLYEIEYQGDSLFSQYNLFGRGASTKYLLKLETQDNKTKLSVSKKEDDEEFDESVLKDGASEFSNDNSSKLSGILFETLKNDISN